MASNPDDDDVELPLEFACVELRLDNVSELKRSDPLLLGQGGGADGGPCVPEADSADWEESAWPFVLAAADDSIRINC